MRILLFTMLVMFSLLVSSVYAFRIVANQDSFDLPVNRGAFDFSFNLQNTENREIPIAMFVASPYASMLNSTDYVLRPNTIDNVFYVRFTKPDISGIGSSYKILVNVKEIVNRSGQTYFGENESKPFAVMLIEPNGTSSVPLVKVIGNDASDEGSILIVVPFLFLAVIVVACVLIYRRKKSRMMTDYRYSHQY